MQYPPFRLLGSPQFLNPSLQDPSSFMFWMLALKLVFLTLTMKNCIGKYLGVIQLVMLILETEETCLHPMETSSKRVHLRRSSPSTRLGRLGSVISGQSHPSMTPGHIPLNTVK